MAQLQRPYIAREGLPLVAAAVAAAGVVQYLAGAGWATPLWLAVLAVIYLFRDPERRIPAAPMGLVSPADGVVTAVEETHDTFLDRRALRIALRMRPWGPYVTRSPTEGKIVEQWRRPAGQGGSGAAAQDVKEHGIWVQTDERDDVVLVVRSGARRAGPSCYVGIGERIGQGQRCGLVPLGARIEVLMPPGSRPEVAVGDRVTAGSDLIATLIHKEA